MCCVSLIDQTPQFYFPRRVQIKFARSGSLLSRCMSHTRSRGRLAFYFFSCPRLTSVRRACLCLILESLCIWKQCGWCCQIASQFSKLLKRVTAKHSKRLCELIIVVTLRIQLKKLIKIKLFNSDCKMVRLKCPAYFWNFQPILTQDVLGSRHDVLSLDGRLLIWKQSCKQKLSENCKTLPSTWTPLVNKASVHPGLVNEADSRFVNGYANNLCLETGAQSTH